MVGHIKGIIIAFQIALACFFPIAFLIIFHFTWTKCSIRIIYGHFHRLRIFWRKEFERRLLRCVCHLVKGEIGCLGLCHGCHSEQKD